MTSINHDKSTKSLSKKKTKINSTILRIDSRCCIKEGYGIKLKISRY